MEPETSNIHKWLFQLVRFQISTWEMLVSPNIHPSISKWLFGVPGIAIYSNLYPLETEPKDTHPKR